MAKRKAKAKGLTVTKAVHPKFLLKGTELPSGRVAGTGNRITDAAVKTMKALRKRDPKHFTYKRLALAFGTSDVCVYRRTEA